MHVVEGDAGIVFAHQVTRFGVARVSLPGEHLSAEDRASVRAWAQAAPGELPRPSKVTQVAESDSAIVFVMSACLRGVVWFGISGVDLPSEELTSIRRWAEAAPGERTWTSYRRQRTFRRLRVAGSPAAG